MGYKIHTRLYKLNMDIRSSIETYSGGKMCVQFLNIALMENQGTLEYTQLKKKYCKYFSFKKGNHT